MKHYPAELSGGQQQRVAIARALAGSPRLLLADEPTGNLDSQMARGVLELLEEINAQGTTIVMVTHDPELAARAQRNVHIVDGMATDLSRRTEPALPRRRAAWRADASASRTERRAATERMFAYYLDLALRSFRRNKVADRADGAGDRARHRREHDHADRVPRAVRRSDPAEERHAVLPCSSIRQTQDGYTPGEEPDDQLTRFDAETLLREQRGDRQAMMTGGSVGHRSRSAPAWRRSASDARYTSADFFPMFDVPFLYGNGWSGAEDEAHARVVVISKVAQREAVRRRQQRRQDRCASTARLPHRRRARRLAADAAVLRPVQRSATASSSRCSCRSRRRAT